MKKLMIGDKTVEIDESAVRPLSDDELEDACGGAGTEARTYCRLVCENCHFKSWWGVKANEKEFLNHFHRRHGCNNLLQRECQYFESNPNLMTD
jgi:hypothetical protein